jgi:DNA-binding Xre family transcriptional regulator
MPSSMGGCFLMSISGFEVGSRGRLGGTSLRNGSQIRLVQSSPRRNRLAQTNSRIRLVRLRPEFAHLYPGLEPGVWETATELAARLVVTTTFRLREVIAGLDPAPSLRRVALDSELDYTTVHAIYHNKVRRVDLATLDALARALGCESGDLIGKVKRGRG